MTTNKIVSLRTAVLIVGAAALVLTLSGLLISAPAVADEPTETTTYVIHQGQGFSPYDVPVAGVAGGFSVDVIQAICDANSAMDCEFKVGSYSDCLTNDPNQPLGLRVGDELLRSESIGCISWGIQPSRISRGLAFTDPIVSGISAPGTPNVKIYGLGTSANTSGTLFFVSGSAGNDTCAETGGFTYANVASPATTIQATVDAAAASGGDFLLAARTVITLPPGYTAVEDVSCPGLGLSVMTFPSANLTDTVSFHKDFRCGLSLIAENGTYNDLCLATSGGLDPVQNSPFCLVLSEIAPPTNECRELGSEINGQ